jgi:N-acetylmuramoyl-L-alanine amidase
MTRTDDVFVSLDDRLEYSAADDADLFISLHADSIEGKKFAESVRGATIYTLSDKASDEQSRLMAEKENASDLIAGIASANQGANDQVQNILFDLMKRETSNFSADFSHVLAKRLGKTITMSRIPRRSAGFKVLKQSHAPSVLIELGYVSNQNDEQQMTTAAWQSKVASSIAAAVQIYFSKRTAERP